MDECILITELNDFIFCPVSIYFHKLYGTMETTLYQCSDQINGTNAHKSVDEGSYSTRKELLMGLDVYCEQFRLLGKIDIYDKKNKILIERKKKIVTIYDGYVFQVYAQCFALREMGYPVESIELRSLDDHKTYQIQLPENDVEMMSKFVNTIQEMRSFRMETYEQTNREKCKRCIYEPACDRSIAGED